MIKRITLTAIVLLPVLGCLAVWIGLSVPVCLLVIVLTDFFLWQRITRYMDSRLNKLEEQIDRHDRECPARKELLLKTCMSTTDATRNSEAFRRTFQAANPTYILRLRELVPAITPAEELLCMYIKMGLSIKEAADRMSISQNSLHTVRYRLKRKLPLQEGGNIDEWLRSIE